MKTLAICTLFFVLGLTQARSTPYKQRLSGKGGIVGLLTGPTAEEINVTMNLPTNVDVLGTFTGVTHNSEAMPLELRYNAMERNDSPEIVSRERTRKASDNRSNTHQKGAYESPNIIIKREDSDKSSKNTKKLRTVIPAMPDKDKVIDEFEKTKKSAMGLLKAIKNYAIESLDAGLNYGIHLAEEKINFTKYITKIRQRIAKDHPSDSTETDGNIDVSPDEENDESLENIDPKRSAVATKNFVVGLGLGLKLGAEMSGDSIESLSPDNLLEILSKTPT